MMRFLVMLEQTETGFAVQAPDLAIVTSGETVEAAKRLPLRQFGLILKPIGKPGSRYRKDKAFPAIWRMPNSMICYSPMLTLPSLRDGSPPSADGK